VETLGVVSDSLSVSESVHLDSGFRTAGSPWVLFALGFGGRACRPTAPYQITAGDAASLAAAACFAAPPPKVIIDTDYNTISDDGEVGIMASQLYAQGVIDFLGFTLPTGNQWRDQEVSDCLKAVERLGVERRVRIHPGSQYPLVHNYKDYLYEKFFFPNASDYVGAYSAPQPGLGQLVPPPGGFATHTKPSRIDAVDFLVQKIHKYPHEVTIFAIGPLTNIAMAIRKDPTIAPLIIAGSISTLH
jgi:purine nucleosidase